MNSLQPRALREGFCIKLVHDRTGFHRYQCSRKKVPGTDYCRQHNPETIKAKHAAREATWAAASKKSEEVQQANQALCRALGVPHRYGQEYVHLTHAEAKRIILWKGTLLRAQRLCREALPQFDWGRSALDANAIQLLNAVPGEIDAALITEKTLARKGKSQ